MARRITGRVAALLLVLMACTLDAQERFGSVTGTVTDSTEAAVPGATVTATNKETGAERVVVTDSNGVYRIPDLTPGRYSVAIELQGFQRVVVDDIIVLLGAATLLQGQGFRDLYNNVYDRVDPFVQAFGTVILTY